MSTALVTLTTDFGSADHYVAVMKGVILRHAPHAALIDVTHQIAPYNIRAAAFVLAHTVVWFPPRTIHLVVVDPGVGSTRRIVAGRWGEQIVVAPDNGLLSMLQERETAAELYEIAIPTAAGATVSHTFHGRDVMAPIAGRLAAGEILSAIGRPVDQPLTMHLPAPQVEADRIVGEILYVDHFGNLVTNIPCGPRAAGEFKCVHVRHHAIRSIVNTYSEVSEGSLLALAGSSGLFEIAVNQGSARDVLDAAPGDEVVVERISSC